MVCDLTNIKTIFNNIDEIRGRVFKETSVINIYQSITIDLRYRDYREVYYKFCDKLRQIIIYNPNIEIEIKKIIIDEILHIMSNIAQDIKLDMIKSNPQRIINFSECLDEKGQKDFLLQEIIDDLSYHNRTYLRNRLKTVNDFKEFLIENNNLMFLMFKPFDCFMCQSNYIIRLRQEFYKYMTSLLYGIQ